ncbi:MAG TPA: ABC transporter permease [Vicinamibacterales bacterium]
MVETFWQDARYALRTLRRAPAFALAALVTLALGIGANAAIFSVVHAVLLRPLPYPEPERLVQFVRRHPGGPQDGQTGRRYLFFRDHSDAAVMAAWRNPTGINLVAGDSAEFVRMMPVSKEFFDVFGVRPALGTAFTADHDRAGGPAAAILSHGLWLRRFGGGRDAIGQSIVLGEQSHVVLGVMPPSFSWLSPADLYVPLRPSTTGPGGGFNYGVVARLRSGITLEQANASAAATWQAMSVEFPNQILKGELPSGFEPLQKNLAKDVRAALLTILGAVALLLVIACANTANLLLARTAGRGREIAVRAALGAGRGRIVRQLLTESVILAVGGGVLGVLLAYWAVPVLLTLTPPGFRVYQEVRLDTTVLSIALAIAIATGLVFGLAPAVAVSHASLVDAFRETGAGAISSGRSAWVRRTLVVAEIALCMLLLVGAGLLVKTFIRIRAIEPGFDLTNVVTARMSLQGERYATPESYLRFFEQGIERLRRIPGVRSAAVVNGVPIERGLNLNVDILDVLDGSGKLRFEDALTDWRYVSVEYFSTMGMRAASGRTFNESDTKGAPPVALVNEEFQRRFYGGESAVGHRIRVYDSDGAIEIVGIVRNVKESGLTSRPIPVMYVPLAQANPSGVRTSHGYFPMSWVVKTSAASPSIEREIREAFRDLDPRQPVSSFRTMEDVRSASMGDRRFQMTLLMVFASIGLLLATAGVYGVVAYTAGQRTREFGIRLALGATRARILRTVIADGVLLAIVGVAIGIGASLLSARAIEGFVWGVSPRDPATFAIVAAVLVVVTIGASLVPALRAIRLNPIRAIREQ